MSLDGDLDQWLAAGEADSSLIRALLHQQGLSLEDFRTILDFGCGCGRVARWWQGLSEPRLFGSDYDGVLTDWCRRTLPFLTVKTNGSLPPLPFRRGSFDFVYAISIFTHLAPPAAELAPDARIASNPTATG